MSKDNVESAAPIDFEAMSADDWVEYLTEHPDRGLRVTDPEGTHEFSYDAKDDRVVFRAFRSQGFDKEGTRSALEVVAGESDGLDLIFYEHSTGEETEPKDE